MEKVKLICIVKFQEKSRQLKRKKEREEQDALDEDRDIAEAALEGPDDEYVWHFPTEAELEKEGMWLILEIDNLLVVKLNFNRRKWT